MKDFDTFPMLLTHCPICRSGPKLNCSDMTKCPLALAKFKEVVLTPIEFAHLYKVQYTLPSVVTERPAPTLKQMKSAEVVSEDQFSLF